MQNGKLTKMMVYASSKDSVKAKFHNTSFPVASPQQVSNFPVASFPKIYCTCWDTESQHV